MQKLTKAEEEIMHMIWEHQPITVTNLIALMDDPKPPHSSISSIVRILERKGFVDHTQMGRSYTYHSAIDKKSYSRFSIRGIVSSYFEGSMNNLVSFLVKEEDLSVEELREMTDLLDDKNEDK